MLVGLPQPALPLGGEARELVPHRGQLRLAPLDLLTDKLLELLLLGLGHLGQITLELEPVHLELVGELGLLLRVLGLRFLPSVLPCLGRLVLGRLQLDAEARVVEAGGERLPPLVDQSHVRARQCVLRL